MFSFVFRRSFIARSSAVYKGFALPVSTPEQIVSKLERKRPIKQATAWRIPFSFSEHTNPSEVYSYLSRSWPRISCETQRRDALPARPRAFSLKKSAQYARSGERNTNRTSKRRTSETIGRPGREEVTVGDVDARRPCNEASNWLALGLLRPALFPVGIGDAHRK